MKDFLKHLTLFSMGNLRTDYRRARSTLIVALLSITSACTSLTRAGQNTDEFQTCPASHLLDTPLSIDRFDLDLTEDLIPAMLLNKNDWPVWVFETGQSDPNKVLRVVVSITGGPQRPPTSRGRLSRLASLFDDGHTKILQIGHSGHQLDPLDGRERLRIYGLDSLRCDVLIVEKYLSAQMLSHADAELIIHGTSLGTIPALDLAANSEFKPHRVIVNAPWLFPLPVKEIVENGVSFMVRIGDEIIDVDDNELEEAATYVYEEFFKLDPAAPGRVLSNGSLTLEKIRREACLNIESRVMLIFARFEDRSDVGATVNFSRCFRKPAELVFTKVGHHGSELAVREVQAAIAEFLLPQEGDLNSIP